MFQSRASSYFYRMRPPYIYLIISIFFAVPSANGQKLTPYTQNNGGGTSTKMDWSIGESASIDFFKTSRVLLNTGVLQPQTNVVTAITEFGPEVFGNQIYIGPNPTTAITHFKAIFTTAGSLKIQVLDAKSQIISTNDIGTIFRNFEKDFSFDQFPSGIYYVKVYFKPFDAPIKTGVYKIIKL